jgi:AcrR family transcriptional regulator
MRGLPLTPHAGFERIHGGSSEKIAHHEGAFKEGERSMGLVERREREKEDQRRRRREEILRAAKTVIRAKGFAGSTMEDVAREAELSSAALYLYFKNKDELFATLSLEVLEGIVQGMEQACAQETDMGGKFERMQQVFFEAYRFEPSILLSLFSLQAMKQFNNLSPEFLSELNRLAVRLVELFSGFFDQGIRNGLFQDHHRVALHDVVWSLFTGLVILEEIKKFFDPEKDYFESTMSLGLKLIHQGLKKT